jgi:hypothetical protein
VAISGHPARETAGLLEVATDAVVTMCITKVIFGKGENSYFR